MGDRHTAYPARSALPTRGTDPFLLSRSSATTTTSTHLRRNLFQSHLTRRPPSAAPGLLPTIVPGANGDGASSLGVPSLNKPSEIIARDGNGEIEMIDPPSPSPDDLKDMGFDERQESERERQRLADTIKYHQQRTSITGHPEELLDAIRASMRAEVSALTEDNWMYEREDIQRPE